MPTTAKPAYLPHLRPEDFAGLPGVVILAQSPDGTASSISVGLRDLTTREPITPESRFRLASVSKHFTAAAILLLREAGRLDLPSKPRAFLPELPAWADAITLAHLLGHTSGVPDYEDLVPPGQTRQVTDADVLSLVAAGQPMFAPGDRYHYSNSAYALLALIVERVSGRTFSDFLRDRIFLPAGMTSAVAHVDGVTAVAERAFGHSLVNGLWTRTDQSVTSAVLGDGGIYASAHDLLAWHRALGTHAVLSPESMALALTPGRLNDGTSTHYGLGWRLPSPDLHFHNGDSIGFRSKFARLASGACLVILMNRPDLPFEAWADFAVSQLRTGT